MSVLMMAIPEAACSNADPEIFYPQGRSASKEAKKICNGTDTGVPCPLLAKCAAWALESDERWGVWGGLSESDRKILRRGTVRVRGKGAH